jgi:hypothetical protein
MSVEIGAVLCGTLVRARRTGSGVLPNADEPLRRMLCALSDWDLGRVEACLDDAGEPRWTVKLVDPTLALRMALFLRARLRFDAGCDARIAVAVAADGGSDPQMVDSAGSGIGIAAERALGRLSRGNNLALIVHGARFAETTRWLAVVGSLLDALVIDWTGRQAEVVSYAIAPSAPRYEDIAQQLGVSKQAIGKALGGAGWNAIRSALQAFENTDWKALDPAAAPAARGDA